MNWLLNWELPRKHKQLGSGVSQTRVRIPALPLLCSPETSCLSVVTCKMRITNFCITR